MAESLWIMPFGIHKDKPIEDLKTSYLEYLMEQDWFVMKFTDGANRIKKELAYREKFGKREIEEDRNWNRR